ncbi:hypothetical protein LT493_34015 [Streptomyces tricolor]|nr:hypothetical protein [Streptomyces tricolor]
MEFAEGQDLQRVLDRDRTLGPADVRKLLDDCLSGLAHLHANGVFHCDIKPSNLLWTADGAPHAGLQRGRLRGLHAHPDARLAPLSRARSHRLEAAQP